MQTRIKEIFKQYKWLECAPFEVFSPLPEATVELSLESPHNVRKKDVGDKPSASASASSLSAATSLTPSPSATLEEVNKSNTPVCSSAVGQ